MSNDFPDVPADFPASTLYQRLSAEFNEQKTRVIISSGQACVMYRLSMASKDGDWIICEADEALEHVLSVLEHHKARYRLGAPLSRSWLAGGWSSHFEYQQDRLRIRADFVSRPPRIGTVRLAAMWRDAGDQTLPVVSIPDLIAIKRTLRDRDYPIIGALALRLSDPELILLNSIAPQHLLRTISEHPRLAQQLSLQRPLLALAAQNPSNLEVELMHERLQAMEADRLRIEAYRRALQPWAQRWLSLQPLLADKPLREVHRIILAEATGLLPAMVQQP
jgi:hypothetical protein